MLLEQTGHDLKLAARSLRRARSLTAAGVLTLAVGIAGPMVMFTLVEGVLLRPLPMRDPERLVIGWKELRAGGLTHYPFRHDEIEALARQSRTLESAAAIGYNGLWSAPVVENGTAGQINMVSVTGDFFRVLGVEPVLGRVLVPADDVVGAEGAVVITHALWQRRYGGGRDILGRRIVTGERPFTIVGVMPPDVEYPRGVEAWITLHADADTMTNPAFREGVLRDVDLFARLRPGASIAQAAAEVQAASSAAEPTAPADAPRGQTAVLRSYQDAVVGDMRRPMLMLFAAVGLVLLIATANVANLLLLRGEARRPELAVRAALGATRGRLAREALAESLVLSVAAGLLALAVARWTLGALIALLPDRLPRPDSVRVDAGVFFFTLALASLAAALAGLAPALASSRVDVTAHLRSGGRGATPRTTRHGRRALVVAQVVLAVVVVAGAGLLTRTLLHLRAVDMGFAADRLVCVALSLPQAKYGDDARHRRLLDTLVARLQATPGVRGATPVNTAPFAGTGGWDAPSITAEGQGIERAAANPSLNLESVHPGYFETLGITLVRGRAFTDRDRPGAPEAAIVSEDVAARVWPGEDPLGRRLKFGGPASRESWRTVVGVARSTRYRELASPRPTLYLPAGQFIAAANMLVVRADAPLGGVMDVARREVRDVDPDIQVLGVFPFTNFLDKPLARPRFNAFLLGLFGAAALLLATIGVYAVMAASVRQRYAEIGIRVALGATRADVRWLVIAEGLRLAGIGSAGGLAGAAVTARVFRGLLFEIQPLDPASLAGAALLMASVCVLASWLPAWRAARLEVSAVLREH